MLMGGINVKPSDGLNQTSGHKNAEVRKCAAERESTALENGLDLGQEESAYKIRQAFQNLSW